MSVTDAYNVCYWRLWADVINRHKPDIISQAPAPAPGAPAPGAPAPGAPAPSPAPGAPAPAPGAPPPTPAPAPAPGAVHGLQRDSGQVWLLQQNSVRCSSQQGAEWNQENAPPGDGGPRGD